MGRMSGTLSPVVGRDRERAVLLETLHDGGPLVAFVHAPAGMGKSALLRTFATEVLAAGAEVVRLDCRAFEPTEHGFLDALSHALRWRIGNVAGAASALQDLGPIVVLAIDTYEVFRISDTWLRSVFAPVLDDRVRVVIAGREPPLAGWFDARGAASAFRSLMLGPLQDEDALEVLRLAGVSQQDARAVNRIARGHPLALQVAAAAITGGRRVRCRRRRGWTSSASTWRCGRISAASIRWRPIPRRIWKRSPHWASHSFRRPCALDATTPARGSTSGPTPSTDGSPGSPLPSWGCSRRRCSTRRAASSCSTTDALPLTPLEFGVLQSLLQRKGKAVSRATLIEEVWGQAYVGGSNVIDVVVRSLRKKLGRKAAALETVRGVGYRFRG